MLSSLTNRFRPSGSLTFVRWLLGCAVFAASFGIASGNWQIAPSGTLRWDEADYAPVGVRTSGEPEELDRIATLGIQDVIVDLPASGHRWASTIEDLEKRKFRYLIRVNSAAPMAMGISVEPQGYRIVGIDGPRDFTLSLPAARSALVVVALKNDGSVSQQSRLPVVNGVLRVSVKGGTKESERVVLVYPEQESALDVDYWQAFDSHRDTLLAALSKTQAATGLRGIVNPLGRTVSMTGRGSRFVPTDPFFRAELARALESRYRNVDSAVRNWGIGSGFVVSEVGSRQGEKAKALTSLADVARLVPLWSGARGVRQFFDPDQNRLYLCDSQRSRAWDDINDVIQEVQTKRFDSLARSIRLSRRIPVIQEWNGWSTTYERSAPQLDGIGIRTVGSNRSDILSTAARGASSALRWSKAAWIVASDVETSENLAETSDTVDTLQSLGARAIYLRLPPASKSAEFKTLIARLNERSLVADRPQTLFFPENALEPGAPQQLTGGTWWLPSPASGNRIDLGEDWFAYRLSGREGNGLYLWTLSPGRHRLKLLKTDGVLVKTLDGSDPGVKVSKGRIELNVGELPILITGTDEFPLPEDAFTKTMTNYGALARLNQNKKRDIVEETLMFNDYVRGLDRNPGGNFTLLRDIYRRMCLRVGDALWIEAESSRSHTMSDSVEVSGCSNGTALTLESRLTEQIGYFAEYTIGPQPSEDLELWIAARIPADRREDVTVSFGSQTLKLVEAPISPYGQGFAWYRLGVTQSQRGIAKLVIRVNKPDGADFAFDTLLLTPDPFRPRGIRVPVPKLKAGPVEKGSDGQPSLPHEGALVPRKD